MARIPHVSGPKRTVRKAKARRTKTSQFRLSKARIFIPDVSPKPIIDESKWPKLFPASHEFDYGLNHVSTSAEGKWQDSRTQWADQKPNELLKNDTVPREIMAMINADFRRRHAESFERRWEEYLRVSCSKLLSDDVEGEEERVGELS